MCAYSNLLQSLEDLFFHLLLICCTWIQGQLDPGAHSMTLEPTQFLPTSQLCHALHWIFLLGFAGEPWEFNLFLPVDNMV